MDKKIALEEYTLDWWQSKVFLVYWCCCIVWDADYTYYHMSASIKQTIFDRRHKGKGKVSV